MTIDTTDRTKLNNLAPNLDIGDVADPFLRLTVFQEIYQYLDSIITDLNAYQGGGAVKTVNLADGSVLTVKLADGAVTGPKILDGAIATLKLADGSVTTVKLADLSVTAAKLADGSVTAAKIADGAINSQHIDAALLASAASLSIQAEFDKRGVNVQKYENLVIGGDWTAAIQEALNLNNTVLVPDGDFTINGTITIEGKKTLILSNKTTLTKPDTADNNEPVLWMRGTASSVRGAGMKNSTIISAKPSPLGVVCIGYKGVLDTTPKNVLYNTFSDVSVIGRIAGGETTGDPSYSLYVNNNQLSGLASYFHNIQNVFLSSANVGLMLEGYANANIINNIQFYQVGNEKQLAGAAIKLKNTGGKYPLDNIITNIFHHTSTNADTLFFDGYVSFNTFQNIVSEQGGVSARWILNNDDNTSSNIISGIDNVSGAWSTTPNFWYKNSIIRRDSINTKNLKSSTLTTDGLGTIKTLLSGEYLKRSGFRTSLLTENTAYALIQVDTETMRNKSGIVELELCLDTSNSLPLQHTAKTEFQITSDSTGVITIKNIFHHSFSSIMIVPVVQGTVITFGVKVPNNGTANTTISCFVNYSVFGLLVQTVTEVTDGSVVMAGATSFTAHLPQTTRNGTTALRPTAQVTGEMYFDTTLGRPIWWNGMAYMETGRLVAVPATATSTGQPGDWAADASFLYICHTANTWKRVAIAAW